MLDRDDPASVVVVGLPRGGVPVAAEVARALAAPLDVIVVRKVGVPFQPELAMGAVGEGGARVVNDSVVRRCDVAERQFDAVAQVEQVELERRVRHIRDRHARVGLLGRTVVVVDDGIATGSTARAACQVARAGGARRVVLAVPVAPNDWRQRLAGVADAYVCIESPRHFDAVGRFYADFSPTSDEDVLACLAGSSAMPRPARELETRHAVVPAGAVELDGRFDVPPEATGVVVFAHGSGSSRFSPRNQAIAAELNHAGLATLLFDLLGAHEERDREHVFDIALLAKRLVSGVNWVRRCAGGTIGELPLGLFGASTGAAAALRVAAHPDADIRAVVSRGGRPDLASDCLRLVHAPTLLVVGERDTTVLRLNRGARELLGGPADLVVVPGASHLFEEPGTLDEVGRLARDWFVTHLQPAPATLGGAQSQA